MVLRFICIGCDMAKSRHFSIDVPDFASCLKIFGIIGGMGFIATAVLVFMMG